MPRRSLFKACMYLKIIDNVLYFIDPRRKDHHRVAVPGHLQKQILHKNHGGVMAGHFSGSRPYELLSRRCGGKIYTRIPSILVRTVQTVWWCQAQVNMQDHHYNPSKLVDHSRLWELT